METRKVIIDGQKQDMPIYDMNIDAIYSNSRLVPVVINGKRVLIYDGQ